MTCEYDCEQCQRKMQEEVIMIQLDSLRNAVVQERLAKLTALEQVNQLQNELNAMKASLAAGNISEPKDIE